MSTRSADRIDLLGIPKKGVRFNLTIPIAEMKRLGEMLATSEGSVQAGIHILGRSLVDVTGQGRAGRFWHMTGSVTGELNLCCERCLGDFNWPLTADIDVGIVLNDKDAEYLPEAMEPHWHESDELNALDLIEDELILALPPIPAHPSPDDCGEWVAEVVSQSGASSDENGGGEEPPRKENPFAILAGLKTGSESGKDE